MIPDCFSTNRPGRLRRWTWLCGLLSLLLVRAAMGTIPIYTNNSYVFFDGNASQSKPLGFNPMINAANFVNSGTFDIENGSVYQTWNTTNFINNKLMEGGMIVGFGGFWFDQHTTNQIPDLWASSFYNPGEIDCQYTLKVWATNIVSPGTLSVASSQLGYMELSGKNVDLKRSTISMSGSSQSGGQIYGFYPTVGAITNFWTPGSSNFLASPNPSTPLFPVPPFGYTQMGLNNPVVFAHDTGVVNSNRMVQVVFISQPNPAIANNVSFDPALNTGNITVQFSGTFVDPTTTLLTTNYLTIQDNFGETTNLQVFGSFPVNYNVFESQSISNPPPPAGLPPGIFGNVSITNAYSFCEVQLASTTASTNNIANGALTNLPGRIQIAAGGDLDLTLASISGANYMSLKATNQFDGSSGAQIVTPFSDISLGVTNGFLTISNLLASTIPVWDGTVVLWSARWMIVDTNAGFTVTNFFHVLFVDALSLSATASAQVQDLTLHGTNSIVISDVLNVMRTLSIDARNLTLTTNGYGNGATSPDGELNLAVDSIFWNISLPYLRNLTNNGAIRTMNLTYFGSVAPTYTTNTTPVSTATATLFETDPHGSVSTNNQVSIGSYTYTFVNTITNTVSNQIKIATTFDGSMRNLIAAINHAAGSGTSYSTNVTTNTFVTAGLLANHSFTVTARTNGSSENTVLTTSSTTNLTWNFTSLSGGADAATNVVMAGGPYGALVNHGLVANQEASTFIYADYFENSGSFDNGILGSFNLQSLNTVLTGGSIIAGGDVSITTGSLVVSNHAIQAGGSLTLQVTNLLTDTGVANGNTWFVGGASLVGLNLPLLPNQSNNPANRSDLLGTTIRMMAPTPNKQVVSTWAATNAGASSNAGFTNNAAIGRLVLDGLGANSSFKFTGTGASNAMYVDYLELRDQATNRDGSGNFTAISNTPNMIIYYAQAVMDGFSIAEKMNFKNGGSLRWVTNYAGFFSSTNFFYNGTNYSFNAALAQSTDIDSNGNGIPNAYDSTPWWNTNSISISSFSAPANFTLTMTNKPVLAAVLRWQTTTNATNYVFYKTNFATTNWTFLTNFNTPASATSPPVAVMISDPVAGPMRSYRVRVDKKH